MTWREFLKENFDTLGVTLFFAALGAGFMLYATEQRSSAQAVPVGRAFVVIFGALLTAAVSTALFVGYLKWDIFLAPLIGALSGLIGFFLLRTIVKAGERVEEKGGDVLGDAVIDRLKKEGEK